MGIIIPYISRCLFESPVYFTLGRINCTVTPGLTFHLHCQAGSYMRHFWKPVTWMSSNPPNILTFLKEPPHHLIFSDSPQQMSLLETQLACSWYVESETDSSVTSFCELSQFGRLVSELGLFFGFSPSNTRKSKSVSSLSLFIEWRYNNMYSKVIMYLQ